MRRIVEHSVVVLFIGILLSIFQTAPISSVSLASQTPGEDDPFTVWVVGDSYKILKSGTLALPDQYEWELGQYKQQNTIWSADNKTITLTGLRSRSQSASAHQSGSVN